MPSLPDTMPESPFGADTPHESFVLQNLEDAIDELGLTICASCPAAIWYRQGVTRCFCSIMKLSMWPADVAVTMCDARENAVAKYKMELTKPPQK